MLSKKVTLTGDVEGQDLADGNVILPISVGQEYHEKDKFSMTLDLLPETFKSVTIVVVDKAKRFTKAINVTSTPEQLSSEAISEGDAWITRNQEICNKILGKKLMKIIRWDDWLLHPEYQEKKRSLMRFMKKTKLLRSA
jgi:hypothetical protein